MPPVAVGGQWVYTDSDGESWCQVDEQQIALGEFLTRGDTFYYIYDFGDR